MENYCEKLINDLENGKDVDPININHELFIIDKIIDKRILDKEKIYILLCKDIKNHKRYVKIMYEQETELWGYLKVTEETLM
ncbi:MAG: hypothetical protein ABSF32_08715 [Ignavibacteria bacterium]|jgi:hypothetical protein